MSKPPQKNGRQHPPQVTLKDDGGRHLSCYVEHSLELGDREYLLLLPVDRPIEIFTWDGEDRDEEPTPVPEEEIDAILPTARAVMAEQNLTLHRSAVTLTVSGDLAGIFDEEPEDIPEDENWEEGYEELQLLASFYHLEQEYAVYTPLDPYFILASINDRGEPTVLSSEELAELEPFMPDIEALLEEHLFDEMDR